MKGIYWGLCALMFLLSCAGVDSMIKDQDRFFLSTGLTAVFVVLSIYFGYRAARYPGSSPDRHHKLELKEFSAEEAELIETDWQKAVRDYARINAVRKTIRDGQMRQQLNEMQQIASNLLDYLETHPKNIPAARRFIDTYQDRAASMAEEFRELERTGLDTPQVAETREHIKETLSSFDEAYEKEFEHVLGEKLLDMDAELSVLQKTMEADGIKNTAPAEAKEESAGSTGKADASIRERTAPGPLQKIEQLWQKHEPSPQRGPHGGGLRNYGGRKHPRRRVFREAEPFRMSMPEELRSSVLKEKLIMSALAIFGGCIGAHKFYQGKTKWGILYLLFWWTAIPGIVGFIEGIRYLFMPMDDFYETYYHDNRR